jgi:hypothetical protein
MLQLLFSYESSHTTEPSDKSTLPMTKSALFSGFAGARTVVETGG